MLTFCVLTCVHWIFPLGTELTEVLIFMDMTPENKKKTISNIWTSYGLFEIKPEREKFIGLKAVMEF